MSKASGYRRASHLFLVNYSWVEISSTQTNLLARVNQWASLLVVIDGQDVQLSWISRESCIDSYTFDLDQ